MIYDQNLNQTPSPRQYPLHDFPSLMYDAALELVQNIQAPEALIGASLLGAVSLAAQNGYEVTRLDGLSSPLSLYLLTIAESGERKSSVDKLVLKPLHEKQKKWDEDFLQDEKKYQLLMAEWKAKQQGLTSKIRQEIAADRDCDEANEQLAKHMASKPVTPICRRMILANTTVEGMQEHWKAHPSMGLISDEADIIMNGRAMSQLSILNNAWSGDSFSVIRRSEPSYTVTDPRLTISLMTQSSSVRKFYERKGDFSRGIGFFARFLIAQPVSKQGYRFSDKDKLNWYALEKFHSRLSATFDMCDAQKKPRVLRLDWDTQQFWQDQVNFYEGQQQPNQRSFHIKDFASKYGEQMARIAALFHVFSEHEGDVCLDCMQRASRLVAWYADEAALLFTPPPLVPQYIQDASALEQWLCNEFSRRRMFSIPKADLYQYAPNALRSKKRLGPALDLLLQQRKFVLVKYGKRLFVQQPSEWEKALCLPQHGFISPAPIHSF